MVISRTQYFEIARTLQMMKYIHGVDFVNGTLVRHPDIRNALLDYEKRYIIDLENDLITSKES